MNKYEEALERARNLLKAGLIHEDAAIQVFPELAESKDEKIRKWLTAVTKNEIAKSGDSQFFQDVLSWINSKDVDPKFKAGDWIVTMKGSTHLIEKVADGRYYFAPNQKVSWDVRECDEISHLWSINDAKPGDVLMNDKLSVIFLEHRNDNISRAYVITINDDNIITVTNGTWELADDIHPATKYQQDVLLTKLKSYGYTWNPETLELKDDSAHKENDILETLIEDEFLDRLIGILEGTNKKDYCESWEKIFLPWLRNLKEKVQQKRL